MFTNKWGRYPWFMEHGLEKIHPDDREKHKELIGNVAVYHCIGVEDDYIKIAFGERVYRVTSDLFKEVPEPRYKIGDNVKLDTEITAVIDAICWHYQEDTHWV